MITEVNVNKKLIEWYRSQDPNAEKLLLVYSPTFTLSIDDSFRFLFPAIVKEQGIVALKDILREWTGHLSADLYGDAELLSNLCYEKIGGIGYGERNCYGKTDHNHEGSK